MEENNKILSIFKDSGLEIDDVLATCKLLSVKVDENKSQWRLCLSFDKVLTCDKLVNLQEKVTKFIVENTNTNFNLLTIIYTAILIFIKKFI